MTAPRQQSAAAIRDSGGTPVLWTCETCGMAQRLHDHGPNTMCPYGLVEAIRAGWITDEEASRRLTAHV